MWRRRLRRAAGITFQRIIIRFGDEVRFDNGVISIYRGEQFLQRFAIHVPLCNFDQKLQGM